MALRTSIKPTMRAIRSSLAASGPRSASISPILTWTLSRSTSSSCEANVRSFSSTSTSARGESESATQSSPSTEPTTVSSLNDLPPVLANLVMKQLLTQASSSTSTSCASSTPSSSTGTSTDSSGVLRIANPFLPPNPAVSLRYQSEFRKAWPSEMLPPGPKTPEGSRRMTFEREGLSVEWVGKLSNGNQEKREDSEKPRFKGHAADRKAKERKEMVKERVTGMDDRVVEWKKNKRDTKTNAKPSLPY